MITKCGLVAAHDLPTDEVYARYRRRDSPGLREMQTGEQSPRTVEDELVLSRSRLERIRFLGVFDTVGSLGIPGDVGKAIARRHQFHDTRLSGYVDIARHAVALDEHRPEFEPTLWSSVPIPIPGHPTSVEQRWFVGTHSDVGGGGGRPRPSAPLSALPREWMADEARKAGLDVDAPPEPLTGEEWRAPLGTSQSLAARLVPGRPYLRPVRTAVGETLDASVLQRWSSGRPPYRPRNPNLAPWVESLLGAG